MGFFGYANVFFNALSNGKIIRNVIAWALRVLGVISAAMAVILALLIIGLILKTSHEDEHYAGIILGSLLFSLFILANGYMQLALFFYRARHISDLIDDHFTILPVLSLILRLIGESLFIVYSFTGAGVCIFIWCTDSNPWTSIGGFLMRELPGSQFSGTGFMAGLWVLIFCELLAFMLILFFYALSEMTVVLVEIALNTRSLTALSGAIAIPSTPGPAHSVTIQESQGKLCSKCSKEIEHGSLFCGECGAKAD